MPKKLFYNKEKCIGCAACVQLAPNIFYMNKASGKADLLDGSCKNNYYFYTLWPDDLLLEKHLLAICPTKAIIIS